MLGLAWLADPTSGAIMRNSMSESTGWPAILLRTPGRRRAAPAGPQTIGGGCDQRQLGGRRAIQEQAPKTDASQQVVAGMARTRSGGVRVLADEAKPDRRYEHGERLERERVLDMDRSEQERGYSKAEPRLEGSPEEHLLTDPRQKGERDVPPGGAHQAEAYGSLSDIAAHEESDPREAEHQKRNLVGHDVCNRDRGLSLHRDEHVGEDCLDGRKTEPDERKHKGIGV